MERFYLVDDKVELTLYWGGWHSHYPIEYIHQDPDTDHQEAITELIDDIEQVLNNKAVYATYINEDGAKDNFVFWLGSDTEYFTWRGRTRWSNE